MIGTADLLKAIKTLWDASGLDDLFKAHWTEEQKTRDVVLEDEQAKPGHAFPYCVLEVETPRVTARMSGPGETKRELRDYSVRFNVHVGEPAAPQSVKEVAAALAEEVMAAFGGHPTRSPSGLTLDSGGVPLVQYLGDWCVRTPNYRWQWVINYRVQVDAPLAL